MSPSTDLETVRALAELARLELSEEELARFAPELERILDAFAVLARPTPGAHAPLGKPALPRPDVSRTREDVPVPSLDREALLASASPKTVGNER
jgi:aspartyl-tRNA(Asn)/glutamyl-tRNA(Gln) amidotransferase subunit C